MNNLMPNPWAAFGYQRLRGHWNGEARESTIYLESIEELNKYRELCSRFAHSWAISYKMTLNPGKHGSYKVVAVEAVPRICAAK